MIDGELDGSIADLLKTTRNNGDIDALVRDFRGSFLIVAFGHKGVPAVLVTDRLNSRKAYSGVIGDDFWIATSLAARPRSAMRPDPTGVAWYLARSLVPIGRTIYRGVEIVDRSSIHRLMPRGWTSERYWEYKFDNSLVAASEADLSHELTARLDGAVARSTADDRDYFLSLSAGYDATAILGVLGKRLRKPQVCCFSYARGTPSPGSDEHIASQLASECGYHHVVLQGYDGPLRPHVELNAIRGHGMAGFCDEADAWESLRTQLGGQSTAVLCGDECLGWTDYKLNSAEDVLNGVQIGGPLSLAWLQCFFPPTIAHDVAAEFADDLKRIWARSDNCLDFHDKKDFLYLDQRLPATILQWRQCYGSQCAPVRNPLLDHDILDFMARVPGKWRVQKRLFRKTVAALFPTLFAMPRTQTTSYHVPLRQEMTRQITELLDWIANSSSLLDNILPVEPMVALLSDLADREPHAAPPRRSWRRRLKHLLQLSGFKDQIRPYVRPPDVALHSDRFLARWLVLRTAMGARRP